MLDLVLFNTHDVILLITVYQCILFSVLVYFIKPQSNLSNYLLVGFLLSTAAIPLDILINYGAGVHEWMIANHPDWFYIFEIGYWTQGPFLLWYIRSVMYKNFKLDHWDLLYLLPFVFYFGHQLFSYHFLPAETKVLVQNGELSSNQNQAIHHIVFARECLRVFFGVIAFAEIRRFKAQLMHRQGVQDDQNFRWLNFLSVGFLALWIWNALLSALILISVEFGIAMKVDFMGLTANYATCGLVGVLIVFVSSKSTVFNDIDRFSTTPTQTTSVNINQNHILALETLMNDDKPYLEANLTLDALSEKLGISSRSLSTIFNRHYGYNFFEFINHYRIKEAKAMLLSPEYRNTTVLDIMYNCGFNSKATFNNFFKKVEGVTPREYKKQHTSKNSQEGKLALATAQ